MPSDDSLFSRLSGARPGIAPKVIRAFPAARRQLRRRASALRGRRNIDFSNALELLYQLQDRTVVRCHHTYIP